MKFFKFNDESKDDSIERLAKYYANGEMSEKEFKKAMREVKHSNFYTVINECYSRRLSQQTLLSQKVMRANKRATGYAPIGYRNVIHRNGKSDVVPDSKVAYKIKKLFDIYATGKFSIEQMLIFAEQLGLVGKISKRPLTKKSLIYILSNNFYSGYAKHKGRLYKHKYKSLIKRGIFVTCQRILRQRGII